MLFYVYDLIPVSKSASDVPLINEKKTGQIVIIRQNMQQTAKLTSCVVIYDGFRSVRLILLTSTCCHSVCKEKVTSLTVFLSLHDYSLLKVIKYSKLHKSGEKGEGARDERKSSSASVFEVANANGPNDLTRGKCEFLSPAICRQKKRSVLFSLFDWAFYIPTKCHPSRH